MSTTTQPPDHGVIHHIRVQKRLDNLHGNRTDAVDDGGIPMTIKTKLSKALDAMSCIPFCQFPFYVNKGGRKTFTVGDVPAGNLYHPDVDVILQKSTPSAFGRGAETVLDPSYRSGREIPAADIGFDTDEIHIKSLREVVNKTMFPHRQIELKLYKLAVYEVGGHFDWHMDSTHSDKHHGTLLVALNTQWEGGDLLLRRNGVVTHVDLRPRLEPGYSDDDPDLQIVAFFTDTEHRVEPVKDGVRIVLQFDIEIVKTEEKEGEAEDDEEDDEDQYGPWMEKIKSVYSERMEGQGAVQVTADKAAVEKVLTIIKELHSEGTETVAFALQYLYRQASISAEFLKGSDAVLYDALITSGDFDVSLHPVVLREASGGEGDIEDRYAYRFDDVEVESSPRRPPKKKQRKEDSRARTVFHIPKLSAVQQISAQDYVEHTGNEAMDAEYRYFGGGMFVRLKAK